MQINNFKRLQEEEERIYAERHEEKVRSGIENSLGAFRFIGQVVDMYLPKIFDLLIVVMGGRTQGTPPRASSVPPSQAPNYTNGKRSPGDTIEDEILGR